MDKGPDAFRTISEVAAQLDLPQHVLRFWETRFNQIKPMKRGGGRRYYRPMDVELLKGIKHLLYGQGYSIKGAQKFLKDNGSSFVSALGSGDLTAADIIAKESKRKDDVSRSPIQTHGRKFFGLLKADDDLTLGMAGDRANKDDKTLLQEALFELIECKRALDRAR